MTGSSFDEATLDFYAREAPDYVADGPDGACRHLNEFLDRLEDGARILELGCGGGRDAEAMLARGFEVDATDGCQEMAGRAETRLGRPVRVMRFTSWMRPAATTRSGPMPACCTCLGPRIPLCWRGSFAR
jgi:hypothetical protein